MFVLEIKRKGEPPVVNLEETAEKCASLAIELIDDGTRKDYGAIRKALVERHTWKADGMSISISKGKMGIHV